jgi:cysteine desulfurase
LNCRCHHLQRLIDARVSYDEPTSVYLDYNAACPPDRRILALYQNTALKIWAHPSSPHMAGQYCQDFYAGLEEQWMEMTSHIFSSLYFCEGSSEGLLRILNEAGQQNRAVITSSAEHNAVLDQAQKISREKNTVLTILDVDRQGKIRMDQLRKALQLHSGALLVYSPVNHETGAIQDCSTLWNCALDEEALVFLDAAQGAARMMPVDWLPYCHGFCLSGQKIYGLKGSGVILLREELTLADQEKGTPDLPGAAAVTEAMRLQMKGMEEQLSLWETLGAEGKKILESGSFALEILSPPDSSAAVLCVCLPEMNKAGRTMEDLFYHLNKDGIYLSRFSACTGSVNGSSRILEAMGFPAEAQESSLRISLGRSSQRVDFFRLKKSLEYYFHQSSEGLKE